VSRSRPPEGAAQGFVPVQFTTVTGVTYAVALPVATTPQAAAIRELVQRRVVVEDGRDARVQTVVRIGDLIVALIIDGCVADREGSALQLCAA
jgi:hypothetical protein